MRCIAGRVRASFGSAQDRLRPYVMRFVSGHALMRAATAQSHIRADPAPQRLKPADSVVFKRYGTVPQVRAPVLGANLGNTLPNFRRGVGFLHAPRSPSLSGIRTIALCNFQLAGWPSFGASRITTNAAAPRFAGFEAWAFLLPELGDFSYSHFRSLWLVHEHGSGFAISIVTIAAPRHCSGAACLRCSVDI
jgi:hypothetical protein